MIRKLLVAVGLILVVAGAWYFLHSRVLTVWVYTDYAFRYNHHDWPAVVENRFKAVNRIYERSRTRVVWKVVSSSETDPTKEIPGLDNRRANMVFHVDEKADVFVILTGVQEGSRTGSVSPFTRYAMVVDFPDKTEIANSQLLALKLARLFGVAHEPESDNLTGGKPEAVDLAPKTATLIRRMRNFPFAQGIDALQGSWEKKAVEAIAEDDPSQMNPLAHAHTVVGTAFLSERKKDRALVEFQQALQAAPNNTTARYNLAEAYARNGQEDKALEQVREIARVEPDKALTHRALGALLGRTHRPDEAVKELQVALHMEPNNLDTLLLLAAEQAAIFGHVDDAIATFQEAVRLNPESAAARDGLLKAQTLKQRLGEALTLEREHVRKNDADADAHYRLAKAEAYSGDLNSAIRDYQKSADLQPKSGTPHVELAEVYLAAGNTTAAWNEIRKARALGTEPPQSLLVRLPVQK